MDPADGEGPESGVGATLKQARVDHEMSVEDVSQRTRIRATLIRQIEDDRFDGCGGAVYARGHIRGIARAIGIDDAPLIAEFDRRRGAAPPEPVAPPLRFDRDPIAARDLRGRRGPRWIPAMVASLVVVFLLALVALLGAGGSSGDGDKASNRSVVTAPTHRTTAKPTAAATSPPPVAFSGVAVQVTVKGNPSWLSVHDDAHRLLLQQVLQPGEVRDFKAAKEIRLVLGNAGSVTMSCNGHDFGSPGGDGQVVNVTFGLAAAGDCTAG